jgi:peptidyl-prolyl cis-trans isomerase D
VAQYSRYLTILIAVVQSALLLGAFCNPQQVGQALSQGKDPAAVAKAAGVEAIVYTNKPQTAIADRKIAAAAFKMTPGQVAPVQGDLGQAIVKVVSAMPGRPVTLAEVKPQLEAEIRADAAKQKTYDLTQVYEDAQKAGSNMAQAAQKAGVAAVTLPAISKDGRDAQGQPVPGLPPQVMETAFNLSAGAESEVEDLGNGEYYAVRVEKITPPAMIPLDEIRPKVVAAVTQRELVTRLQAKADELSARVKKGESLDAVAASVGQKVVRISGLNRQTAAQNTQVSQDLLGKAFGTKAGDVFTAENTHFGLVVGKLEAVRPGDTAMQGQIAEQMRQPMSQAIFREIGEAAQTGASRAIKVKLNPAMARSALGLAPEEAPAKPGLAK